VQFCRTVSASVNEPHLNLICNNTDDRWQNTINS
jgi:hypothetical protein